MDGNYNNYWASSPSCAHGDDGSGGPNWLVVDLGREYHVLSVVLTGRADICFSTYNQHYTDVYKFILYSLWNHFRCTSLVKEQNSNVQFPSIHPCSQLSLFFEFFFLLIPIVTIPTVPTVPRIVREMLILFFNLFNVPQLQLLTIFRCSLI